MNHSRWRNTETLIFIFAFILLNAMSVFAGPSRTTYQAKIVKPDGYPLEAATVNFKFTILDPAGSCILYSETYSSVNMSGTGGLISFALGSGVKTYPASATTFEQVFSNITPSLSCDAGGPGNYVPGANDNRKIVMQFHDGNGWQTLPAMSINAVPYAMYANDAQKLDGKVASDFVQVSTLANCGVSEALRYNGATFSCVAIDTGAGVTSGSVTTALGYTPADGASVTALSSSLATTNSNVSAVSSSVSSLSGNLASVSAAVSAVASDVFAVSSTVSSLSTTVSNLTSTVSGISNTVSGLSASMSALVSSQWEANGDKISYNSGFVGIGTSSPMSALELVSSTASIHVNLQGADNAGASVRYFSKRGAANETLGSSNPSANNKGWSVGSIGDQNAATTRRNNFEASYWNGTAWSVPFVITASGSVGIGGATVPVTKLEVSGGLRISMESASCAAALAGTLRYNSGTVEYCNGTSWLPFGVAGAGITSVNGSTSGSQTFATGITGTVFNISTVNGVHTFNIPLAASSSVTAGLLSNTDYLTFTNKLNATSAAVASALGYTPLDSSVSGTYMVKANNLSDLASATVARTNLGLGSLATLNYLDLGSAFASGTLSIARLPAFSGDASSSAGSNVLTLASVGAGVTSGTQYTKVTVDGKGRVISGAQLSVSDVTTALGYTPASASASTQWTTSGSAIFYNTGGVGVGTANPTALFDVYGASATIAIGSSTSRQLRLNGKDSAGTSPILDYYAAASNPFVIATTINNNHIALMPNGSGNVGIATSSPTERLSVAGNMNLINGGANVDRYVNVATNGGNEKSFIRFDQTAVGGVGRYWDIGSISKNNIYDLGFEASGTRRMTITFAGNVGVGTSAPVTKLDVAGGLKISMEAATCAASYAGTLRYNSGNVEYCNGSTWTAFGAATVGLTSLNGSASQTQNFANGVSGNAPAFVTANGVHTLNIPLASAAGSVTAGLISNADYVNFSNKITSSAASIAEVLGYTPASASALANYAVRANNLSDLTSSATARTNLGLGTFATASTIDLGSASATGILADARLANQSGVTSGTQYTKVTVDGKGRVISGAQLSVGDVTTALGYTPASASAATQWTTSGSAIYYNTGNVGIGTANPQVPNHFYKTTTMGSVGSLNLNNSIVRIQESTSTTMNIDGNTIATDDDLYLGTKNANTIQLFTSDTTRVVIGSTGNVGIGVNSASAKLHLVSGSTTVAPLKFTSGALTSAAQAGAVEYDGANLYFTDGTNTRRALTTGTSSGSIDNASTINSTGNITMVPAGSVVVSSTVASTNSSTGALIVGGGVGVAGNIFASGTITTSSNIQGSVLTATTSTVTPYVYGSTASGGSLYLEPTTHATKGNVLLASTGGKVGVGNGTPAYKLEIFGTSTIADRTIGINGIPVAYLPDQALYAGSLAVGNGLRLQASAGGTTGQFNTAVGIGAGVSNTTGAAQTAVGYLALAANTTGVANSALGTQALMANTTGAYNNAIGYNSLAANTTGTDNNAVGKYAMMNNTTGSNNVAIGTSALQYNVGKRESTAIGYNAMGLADSTTATTITYNTAIGAYALLGSGSSAANTGTMNTALGHSALKNLSSGTANIGIGYSAGSAITTGSYNVVIGSNTGAGIATASNTILIADGAGVERMRIDSAGDVGIGVTNPGFKLDVSGTVNASGIMNDVATVSASTFTMNYRAHDGSSDFGGIGLLNSGSNRSDTAIFYGDDVNESLRFVNVRSASPNYNLIEHMRLTSDGKLGLGNTNPTAILHITEPDDNWSSSIRMDRSWDSADDYFQMMYDYEGLKFRTMDDDSAAADIIFKPLNSEAVRITKDGNVGIGASAPTTNLDIFESQNTDTTVNVRNISTGTAARSGFTLTNSGTTYGSDSAGLFLNGTGHSSGEKISLFSNSGIASGIEIVANASTAAITLATQGLERMRVSSGGNIGIGTSTPTAKFEVSRNFNGESNTTAAFVGGIDAGYANTGAYFVQKDNTGLGSSNTLLLNVVRNNTSQFAVTGVGYVGIGTTAPNSPLTVANANDGIMTFKTTDNTWLYTNWLDSAGTRRTWMGLDGTLDSFQINVENGTSKILLSGGNVGIGTLTPGYKLDVNGTIRGYGITDSSDIRLKKHIQPLDLSLEKILSIKGVSYYWKDTSMPKKQIGFIAQDLEKVYPELVETDYKGMKSVNYSHLVAPLIEAFKTLYAKVIVLFDRTEKNTREIASVKQENAELKARVEKTEKENEELKQRLDRIEKALLNQQPNSNSK